MQTLGHIPRCRLESDCGPMSNVLEAQRARRDLKRSIMRADRAAKHCLAQVCDGDLRPVDRQTAEHRMILADKTRMDLQRSLDRVNEALEQ